MKSDHINVSSKRYDIKVDETTNNRFCVYGNSTESKCHVLKRILDYLDKDENELVKRELMELRLKNG